MAADTEIEISAARTDELDAIIRLVSAAFSLPLEAARDVFFADPYLDVENKRALRVNGEIVSCLTIIETTCRIGRGTARLAGIAGVVTLPRERRKGYAARLLLATLQTLRERRYPLCALVPFEADYYRRLGWEQAALSHRYLTAPQHLPNYPEARFVRAATPDDLYAVSRIYDAQADGKTLHCLRDAKRWKYLYDNVKQRAVFERDGHIEGYLWYEFVAAGLPEPPPDAGAIVPILPPTLRILEMVAETPAARRGLLGHLAAQTGMGCIEAEARLDTLHRSGLLHPMQGALASLASIDIAPTVMARITDFSATIKALLPNWERLRGQMALTLTDETLPEGGASVLLLGHGDSVTHLPLPLQDASACPDRLVGDVRAWSQVALGYLSGDDACALGKLAATTPRALENATRLFPRREPFLPLPDHF